MRERVAALGMGRERKENMQRVEQYGDLRRRVDDAAPPPNPKPIATPIFFCLGGEMRWTQNWNWKWKWMVLFYLSTLSSLHLFYYIILLHFIICCCPSLVPAH
ncbi:hypothetical protein PanWU01x14_295600, partial [Parasponia andersonii]